MDAARAADGGTGVLLLYRNYAGDVMNFNMATERLGAEAVEARTVLVNDAAASAPPDRKDERRGTAGGVFVFRCAGAAADLGLPIAEVDRLARHANARIHFMGLPSCPARSRSPAARVSISPGQDGSGHGHPRRAWHRPERA